MQAASHPFGQITTLFCILVFLSLPTAALACPGCIEANEANREAFLFTTGLLTLIPLIVIGCIVRFLQLKAKRHREEQSEVTSFKESPDLPS